MLEGEKVDSHHKSRTYEGRDNVHFGDLPHQTDHVRTHALAHLPKLLLGVVKVRTSVYQGDCE